MIVCELIKTEKGDSTLAKKSQDDKTQINIAFKVGVNERTAFETMREIGLARFPCTRIDKREKGSLIRWMVSVPSVRAEELRDSIKKHKEVVVLI